MRSTASASITPPRSTTPSHNATPIIDSFSGPTMLPAASTDVYARFQALFYSANQSVDPATRADIYGFFNTEMAPHLCDELSYFQLLVYKLAHLWQTEGQVVDCQVTQDGQGAPSTRWAPHYQVSDLVANKQQGGISFMLHPLQSHGGHASAMLFPGTGPAYKRDVLVKSNYPRGVRDDIHWRGVGHRGFAHNRDVWLEHVRGVVSQGRELVLVGHSLGATYACRLFVYAQHHLPAEQAQRISLISFYPPGLPRQILRALLPYRHRIQLAFHQIDATSWCGSGHPAGGTFTTSDTIGTSLVPFQVPHAVPQFAIRRLRGELPRHSYVFRDTIDWHVGRLPAEWVRKAAGVAHPLLKA